MSGNTSATGGPLLQSNAVPLNDAALDDLLQQLVVGVTGLPGTLVRPRWQRPSSNPNAPPTQPPPDTDWASIGIVQQETHDYPFEYQVGAGDGYTVQVTWETIEVLASFFGPNCRSNASTLRAGMYISQNREILVPVAIKLREVGVVRLIPDLVNMQWISHCDVSMILDREIHRNYAIENLVSAEVDFSVDESPLMTAKVVVSNS
jgi:hypothetical protein